MTQFISITGRPIPMHEEIRVHDVREVIVQMIRLEYPGVVASDFISLDELNHYRRSYLVYLMEKERGELEEIDQDVVRAMKDNATLSENVEPELNTQLTSGEKLADRIAAFGGSWTFIIAFFSFIVLWMLVNSWALFIGTFDPFPFILLNLILSCLAAIQAPIIMMSQNRQEQKDRIRSEHDYRVNLKAELEIKILNEKMDHLLMQQNRKMIEFQEVQIDYIEDLMNRMKSIDSKKK